MLAWSYFFCSFFLCINAASSPPSSEWDIEYLAALVDNAYCSSDEFSHTGVTVGNATLLKSLVYSEYDQRVDIYIDPDYDIVVAYEGTNDTSWFDWLYDIDFIQVGADNSLGITGLAGVHQGFQHQHEAVWPRINSTLQSVLSEYSNATITVIGHSMGASICQLGALAIQKEFGLVEKIISYAPVRTGNAIYATAFNEVFDDKYLGVWNGQDWVPWILLPILGYQHPDNLIWINPENTTEYQYFEHSEDWDGPATKIPKIVTVETIEGGISQLIKTIESGKIYDAITAVFDLLYWGAHEGIYFHTDLYAAAPGACPATIGGH